MRPLILLTAFLIVAMLATGRIGTLAEGTGSAETGAIPAPTQAVPPRDQCLSPADLREAVAEKRVIEPVAAIRAARQILPRAEIQRASLCRNAVGLVYLLTILRRDGHFVHVMVDAQSGQVSGP